MLTVSSETNLYDFIVWIDNIVGRAPYWVWKGGIIPDGPGAYAVNEPIGSRNEMRDRIMNRGLFCAAVPNLALRTCGKRIPTKGDPTLDGGIAAYFTGKFGPGYFSNYDEPFNLDKAVRWAQETRSGVLLGQGYWGPEIWQQGHTGILLPSGYILQSAFGEGLHWYRTIYQERAYWNDGGVMVAPWNWIEYKGDLADWAK